MNDKDNRAMLALDAEDNFSDRHDPEALMGEYELPVGFVLDETLYPTAMPDNTRDADPWLCLHDFPDGDPHQSSAHDD